ncbi:hypothetical protein [Natronospira bacteriovora]|uniref:WD40 repeat protein n=1 Tax=Natronospira bacteriovora TaxID=3069753 RepID=A0ABU0W7Q4_9GAMM|nr:hypothetical protein [Natronospira sp. AB-CW4]MDQ2070062.1 hypothetical protein [Natronospira sp. AB-CW4]
MKKCLALLCLLWMAPAMAVVDPFLDWRSLDSEHFTIHFPAELEDDARRALWIAEDVHERLSQSFNWTPRRQTQVVLTDQFDLSNGFASPLPYNFIYLFLTPPDGLGSLGDYDDWLELLITHEYTHTLHLDKARAFPRGARSVLGRNPLLFPNLFNPTWLIEGLAIYEETDWERGIGRGQSTLFDMKMRLELESGFKPFDQVGMDGITTWPAGRTPYLYGAYFFQYLEAEHGEDSVRALVENYSNNVIPYLVNRNLRQTLADQRGPGLDGEALWSDFERWLGHRFRPHLDAIREQGEVAGERLSRHGYQTASPRALNDGRVFYLRADARRQPALMEWTADEGIREIADVNAGGRLDVHPRAGAVVAMPELCRNRNLYYDLFHVDVDSGKRRRLTRCSRYREAVWHPDGEWLAASRIEAGQARLDWLDSEGRFQSTLWTPPVGAVPGRLDFSPDGQRIAMSLWRPELGWTLGAFDLRSGEWQEWLADSALVGEPRFAPDGDQLLFSSEHGGVFNLRRLDLDSGRIDTLSNVTGGAFSPTQSAHGDIFYIGYTADGYDLFRLSNAMPIPGPGLPEHHGPGFQPRQHARAEGEDRRYRPWSTLRPTSWYPLARATEATTELGVSVASFDALQIHDYAVAFLYEPSEDLASGLISYTWADRIAVAFSRVNEFESEEVAEDDWQLQRARQEDRAQLQWLMPVTRQDWQLIPRIGGSYTRDRDRRLAEGVEARPGFRSGAAGVAVDLDTRDIYPRSISPSHGRWVRLLAESNEAFGSPFSGEVYSLDWREYLPLGGEHVLALRATQAWGTERPRPFRLGGVSQLDLLGAEAVFERRRYALRGYDEILEGRRLRLLGAEWRFPIARPERGFTRFPLGAHQFSGRLFTEQGAVWDLGDNPDLSRRNVGAELVIDANIFYRANFRLRLGVARGRDEGGETQGYLLLGLPTL